MRQHIHPNYRQVVFHDTSVDVYYRVGSTIVTNRTIVRDGALYPYVTLDVSAASHPHYTGKQKQLSQEGSTAKFNQRFGHFIKSSDK